MKNSFLKREDSLVLFSKSLKLREQELLEQKDHLSEIKQDNQALRMQMKSQVSCIGNSSTTYLTPKKSMIVISTI